MDRCLDHPDALSAEDLIEGRAELGVPIVEQEADGVVTVIQLHDEVARLLGHPRTVGVARAPGQMHAPPSQLDEEQDVDPPQRHGLDGEEVGRNHALSLPTDERPPGRAPSPRRGLKTVSLEDITHRGLRDRDPKLCQLADDPSITPTWVLASEAHYQR